LYSIDRSNQTLDMMLKIQGIQGRPEKRIVLLKRWQKLWKCDNYMVNKWINKILIQDRKFPKIILKKKLLRSKLV